MPNLNALAPVSDIQSVIQFVNQQINNGTARISPEAFYSKQLLDTIRIDESHYVYFRYAEAQPIQERADRLYLRRWSPLQAHTVPLEEGVPPKSDKGSVKKYELVADQYGRYMEFTDKVDFKVVDPVVAHYSKEYAIVAIETLDLLARNALSLSAQRFYAGGGTSFDDLTFASTPNMLDLRKIVLSMKRQLVKPRQNGRYHVIGSPEFFFDMIDDDIVKSYMSVNQTTKTMFDDTMLVPLFGMEFYETLVVPTGGEYVDASGDKRLKIWKGTLASPTYSTATSGTYACLTETTDLVPVAGNYVMSDLTNMPASYIPGLHEWNVPVGSKEFKAQHIFVLGAEALARTGLAGEDSAKVYVKALGSAGVLDPIDQRQSIGFKINSVGFGSTRPEAIVDYVCVPTMVNM